MRKTVLLALCLIFMPAFAQQNIRFNPIRVATSASLGASLNTTAIDMTTYQNSSIMAVWSGSPVGNFKLQISNDIVDLCSQVTNWVDYSGSTTAAGGAAGSFIWNLGIANYKCLRLVYVRTSGTGTLNAIAGVK